MSLHKQQHSLLCDVMDTRMCGTVHILDEGDGLRILDILGNRISLIVFMVRSFNPGMFLSQVTPAGKGNNELLITAAI